MSLYNILKIKSLSVNALVFATSVLLWALCLRLYVLVCVLGKRLFRTWLLLYRTWENRLSSASSTISAIVCIDLRQTGSVSEGSDHLRLIKFWPSRTPGKGVCGGAKFFWLRLTTARAQCLRLSERFFFIYCCVTYTSVCCYCCW